MALQRRLSTSVRSGGSAGFDSASSAGLRVYRNNFQVQLRSCLKDSFPRVHAWLGDDRFELAADQFIEAFPPRSWTLGHFGDRFSEQLEAAHPNDPEIAELAWIDWAISQAFIAADCKPIEVSEAPAIDWDAVCLTFGPSVQFRISRTNSAAIWQALANDHMPPPATALAENGGLLVWRMQFEPCFRELDHKEIAAISLCAAGLPFRDLCAVIARDVGEDDAALQAGNFLGRWLSDGLIATTPSFSKPFEPPPS